MILGLFCPFTAGRLALKIATHPTINGYDIGTFIFVNMSKLRKCPAGVIKPKVCIPGLDSRHSLDRVAGSRSAKTRP
jgi:hypothetical protein